MGFITLEQAQEMVSPGGHFPAWIADLGLRVEHLDAKSARLRLPRNPRIQRPGGVLLGQALMAAADTSLVLAFSEAMGRMPAMATISLTTNFMRAAQDCDVLVEAVPLKIGRTTAFGEVTFTIPGDPAPIAKASATFAIMPEAAAAKFVPASTKQVAG